MKKTHPLPSFEPTDASPRAIGLTAAGLAAVIVASLFVARTVLPARKEESFAAGLGQAGLFSNGAAQRTDIEKTWLELEAESRRHLSNYAWVDRSAGIVRIPIEEAMRLVAERNGARSP